MAKTHISIELTHEAGEIVVLKVGRQNPLREIQRLQNNKTVAGLSPRDEPIRCRIVHHLIRFHHKRRYYIITGAVINNLHPAHNCSNPHTHRHSRSSIDG